MKTWLTACLAVLVSGVILSGTLQAQSGVSSRDWDEANRERAIREARQRKEIMRRAAESARQQWSTSQPVISSRGSGVYEKIMSTPLQFVPLGPDGQPLPPAPPPRETPAPEPQMEPKPERKPFFSSLLNNDNDDAPADSEQARVEPLNGEPGEPEREPRRESIGREEAAAEEKEKPASNRSVLGLLMKPGTVRLRGDSGAKPQNSGSQNESERTLVAVWPPDPDAELGEPWPPEPQEDEPTFDPGRRVPVLAFIVNEPEPPTPTPAQAAVGTETADAAAETAASVENAGNPEIGRPEEEKPKKGLLARIFGGKDEAAPSASPEPSAPVPAAREKKRVSSPSGAKAGEFLTVEEENTPFHVFDAKPGDMVLVEMDSGTVARVKSQGGEWSWLQLHSGLMGVMRNRYLRPANQTEIMQFLAMETDSSRFTPANVQMVDLDLDELPTTTREDSEMPLGFGLLPPVEGGDSKVESEPKPAE